MGAATVLHGDCLDVLKTLPDASVDSLVTDPPAGIGFMGREWDHHKGGRQEWVAWMTAVMVEALRVLKPGGHGLVWALPRTSHWTATALEDAGFEIREIIHHHFGSGFPKSLDVSKAIDKAAGVEREIVGSKLGQPGYSLAPSKGATVYGVGGKGDPLKESQITAPATDAARQWDGWGTATKPATEHWILVRKPLSEKTVAANVLAWGVGGINIDATRVGSEVRVNPPASGGYMEGWGADAPPRPAQGRWPANLLLSHGAGCVEVGTRKVSGGMVKAVLNRGVHTGKGTFSNSPQSQSVATGYADADGTETVPAFDCEPGCPVAELDAQSGVRPSGGGGSDERRTARKPGGIYRDDYLGRKMVGEGRAPDTGGASRFFPTFRYIPKAPSKERPVGPDGTKHPTVKSLTLMKFLCRLITPPGGMVLDPFAGSGATVEAALLEGFDVTAIEAEAAYLPLIESRIERVGVAS